MFDTEWQDLKMVTEYIISQNYIPTNSIKHLAIVIMAYFACDAKVSRRFTPAFTETGDINMPKLVDYVNANGGLCAFDL